MAALVSIDDDEERARATARRAIVGLFHPVPHPYYDHLLRVQGHADVADAAAELAPRKQWAAATAAVSDALLDELTITGTPAQCVARLRAYDAVASEVICLDSSAEAVSTPSSRCSPMLAADHRHERRRPHDARRTSTIPPAPTLGHSERTFGSRESLRARSCRSVSSESLLQTSFGALQCRSCAGTHVRAGKGASTPIAPGSWALPRGAIGRRRAGVPEARPTPRQRESRSLGFGLKLW